jgi:hypothetical protein
MPVVKCPQCQTKLRPPVDRTTFKCPRCSKVLRVPGKEPPSSAPVSPGHEAPPPTAPETSSEIPVASETQAELPVGFDLAGPPPAPPPRRKWKIAVGRLQIHPVRLAVALAIGLVVLGGVIAAQIVVESIFGVR